MKISPENRVKFYFPELFNWIHSSLFPELFRDYIEVSSINIKGLIATCTLHLYSPTIIYQINVERHLKERSGFLYSMFSGRYEHGSNDLIDGRYTENTWNLIVENIKRQEGLNIAHKLSDFLVNVKKRH